MRIIGREPKSCKRCKNRRMDYKRFWQESADDQECFFCDAGYDMEAASKSADDGSEGGGEDTACEGYVPRFLDLPISVAAIAVPDACSHKRSDASIVPTSDTGRIADVWLCEEGKTFSPDAKPLVGIVIGEAACEIRISYNAASERLSLSHALNPVIYVPSLDRFVYGVECNWRVRSGSGNVFAEAITGVDAVDDVAV